jgi:DNA-3-methyladenine glycosylase
MRDTYGHWYVYFTYGMHYCVNVTCDKDGIGAVLIRAVEPFIGLGAMKRRRKTNDVKNLCSGPAKFCEAFGVTKKQNGMPVGGNFAIYENPKHVKHKVFDIGISARVGISAGTSLPWRFYIKDNSFVSR